MPLFSKSKSDKKELAALRDEVSALRAAAASRSAARQPGGALGDGVAEALPEGVAGSQMYEQVGSMVYTVTGSSAGDDVDQWSMCFVCVTETAASIGNGLADECRRLRAAQGPDGEREDDPAKPPVVVLSCDTLTPDAVEATLGRFGSIVFVVTEESLRAPGWIAACYVALDDRYATKGRSILLVRDFRRDFILTHRLPDDLQPLFLIKANSYLTEYTAEAARSLWSATAAAGTAGAFSTLPHLVDRNLGHRLFLSHRRVTGQGIVSRLYSLLTPAYAAFWDAQASFALHELMDHVHRSMIFVAVFTPGYFDSKWCMVELRVALGIGDDGSPDTRKPIIVVHDLRYDWRADAPSDVLAALDDQGVTSTAGRVLPYVAELSDACVGQIRDILGISDTTAAQMHATDPDTLGPDLRPVDGDAARWTVRSEPPTFATPLDFPTQIRDAAAAGIGHLRLPRARLSPNDCLALKEEARAARLRTLDLTNATLSRRAMVALEESAATILAPCVQVAEFAGVSSNVGVCLLGEAPGVSDDTNLRAVIADKVERSQARTYVVDPGVVGQRVHSRYGSITKWALGAGAWLRRGSIAVVGSDSTDCTAFRVDGDDWTDGAATARQPLFKQSDIGKVFDMQISEKTDQMLTTGWPYGGAIQLHAVREDGVSRVSTWKAGREHSNMYRPCALSKTAPHVAAVACWNVPTNPPAAGEGQVMFSLYDIRTKEGETMSSPDGIKVTGLDFPNVDDGFSKLLVVTGPEVRLYDTRKGLGEPESIVFRSEQGFDVGGIVALGEAGREYIISAESDPKFEAGSTTFSRVASTDDPVSEFFRVSLDDTTGTLAPLGALNKLVGTGLLSHRSMATSADGRHLLLGHHGNPRLYRLSK
jgi:hypothetical protein